MKYVLNIGFGFEGFKILCSPIDHIFSVNTNFINPDSRIKLISIIHIVRLWLRARIFPMRSKREQRPELLDVSHTHPHKDSNSSSKTHYERYTHAWFTRQSLFHRQLYMRTLIFRRNRLLCNNLAMSHPIQMQNQLSKKKKKQTLSYWIHSNIFNAFDYYNNINILALYVQAYMCVHVHVHCTWIYCTANANNGQSVITAYKVMLAQFDRGNNR